MDVETTGTAEVEAAEWMIERTAPEGATVGADKAYDQEKFVAGLLEGIQPQVARQKSGSAVGGRTARGKGYAMSLRKKSQRTRTTTARNSKGYAMSLRKRVEEAFGWIKTVGGFRNTRHQGLAKVSGQALLCFAAYNRTRLLKPLTFTPVAAPT